MSQRVKIPVSIGELLDKLSILEIKSERIEDKEKLINILREKDLLQQFAQEWLSDTGDIARLYRRLKQVNNQLWEIEDRIRNYERKQDFGRDFIETARAVYHQNDIRAAIKKEINLLLNSELVEEKSYQAY